VVVLPLKLGSGDFDLLTKKIASFLTAKSLIDSEPAFVQEVDPKILGGFKVLVGSVVLDLTLSGKIKKEIWST